jgi:iron complex outermembrane recepter protein
MRRGLAYVLCLFLLLAVPRQSHASALEDLHQQSAVLKGIVTDPSGAAVPGASIELEGTNVQATSHATTDATGRYSITAPTAGIYRETIAASGFRTVVIQSLRLSTGIAAFRDVTLEVGLATDSILVFGVQEIAGGQVAIEDHVGIFGDLPVLETPFNIQSYSGSFLENRQALTLTDVLDSDASIVSMASSSKASPYSDNFMSRGFKSTEVSVNGLFDLYSGLPDMSFVERVDVFSGPSAFVMGAPDAVGGVINLAPKRAGERPYLLLEPNYLGKSVYGGRLDASDRRGPHGSFGARANALYREGEGEIRDSRLLNAGAALGLDYKSKIVLLALDTQYLRNYDKAFQYVLLLSPGLDHLPPTMPSNLSTQPVWVSTSTSEEVILGRVEVNLSPNWVVTAGSGLSHSFVSTPGYCPILLLDYSGTVLCEQISQVSLQKNYSADLGVRGKVHTGVVSHSILAGWNRVHDTASFGEFNEYGPSQPYNLYTSYRPKSPNYVPPVLSAGFVVDDESTKGWYLGDTAGLLHDRLLLSGGFRRTTMRGKETFRGNSSPSSHFRESVFTPSTTGLFKLTSRVSLYGNFIQALEPGWIAPPGTKNAGQIFPPLVSNQLEVGAKSQVHGWIATIALYRISEANGVVNGAANPPTFSQDGRQVNKGIDLNFAGDLLHGLHAILSASFIDSRQRRTGDFTIEGKSTANVPKATERVNLNWDVPHAKGLALDCNLMETGSAPLDAVNSIMVPSWTRLDLGARYSFVREKPFTIRAQVENISNNGFWISVFSGGLAPAGPRVVNIAISKSF